MDHQVGGSRRTIHDRVFSKLSSNHLQTLEVWQGTYSRTSLLVVTFMWLISQEAQDGPTTNDDQQKG